MSKVYGSHLLLELCCVGCVHVTVLWWSVNSTLLKEYQNGCTPNPDILCNRQIKFDAFYKYALGKLDANAIATGHYACTTFGNFLEYYDTSAGMQFCVNAGLVVKLKEWDVGGWTGSSWLMVGTGGWLL